MTTPEREKHWLVRPRTIRGLWIVFYAILSATVLGDLFVHHHDHFWIETTFGFAAWFGFVTCALMIFGAKALGILVKRPDDYYRPSGEDTDD